MSNPVILITLVVLALGGLFAYLGPWRTHVRNQRETASTCGDVAYPGGTLDVNAWHIGPVLAASLGGTKSPGMPPHPTQLATGGFEMDVPVGIHPTLGAGDKLDSLAFKHGPLTGKKQIQMTYEVAPSSPTAELLAVPEIDPAARYKARMTLYFQREGDNWSADAAHEAYRWYYTGVEVYLEPGVHDLTVPLDSGWTAIMTSTIASNPRGFKDAIDHCCCVGFGFGGNENGRIHGMIGTEPVKIRCTRFSVQ